MYFLQYPVLQLLKKLHKTLISTVNYINFDRFVLRLVDLSFLPYRWTRQNKGERWSNWAIVSKHIVQMKGTMNSDSLNRIYKSLKSLYPVLIRKKKKNNRQRHNRNLFSWQQFNNKRKCSEPFPLLLGNFNLEVLVSTHENLQIPL